MSIGLGIAVAGIWMFPTACAISGSVTSQGLFMSVFIAGAATWFLASGLLS